MRYVIAAAFSRGRTTLVLLLLVVLGGLFSYATISKEANPEIEIPMFTVNVTYSGISARDSSRLLIEPLERRLQSLNGLRRITGQAGENFATVVLEFHPGYDQSQAFQDVRDEVDNARADLPDGADAPIVREVDLSIFPILTVALSGSLPERDLIEFARSLSDDIESISGVLEARLQGDREDQLEIIVDPLAVQSYGISAGDIAAAVRRNNQLVPAGAFDTGSGRIGVSIPGTIQSIADVLVMPVRVSDGIVVRVQDVAEVRQTYKDPVSFARIDGRPTIGIDITKSAGANILDTVAGVRSTVEAAGDGWPSTLRVDYLQNQADDVRTLLGDLENSVLLAVLMVMLPTILALGLRPSLLIGLAIPGSFFGGILTINLLGFTLNLVVLFGLILVIGMLVDGAMVVVELAERKQDEGATPRDAFRQAAQRMAWPVISSIATSLAVFFPLLFWPGPAGQFMFYLPATVIVTLTVSLAMALIFVPVIGSALASAKAPRSPARRAKTAPRFYDRVLSVTIGRPGMTVGLSILVLIGSFFAYGQLGRGVEFFPAIEPERAQIQITADGNLSVHEADRLVELVEQRVIGTEGIERAYSRTIGSVEQRLQSNLAPDIIGTIQVDFLDWQARPKAEEIIASLREATAGLPGIGIQIEEANTGLAGARPVEVEIFGDDTSQLANASRQVQQSMDRLRLFTDISSDVPVPAIEARLQIDREQAARYGVDVETLGDAARLMTNGVVLGSYVPDDLNDEVDITLRFPAQDRNLAQLGLMRVSTDAGMVPVSNFVSLSGDFAPTLINRAGGENVQTISSGLAPGVTVADALATLETTLAEIEFAEGVGFRFAGEIEDMQETIVFLLTAFVLAIFLMFLIMLMQLNSFFQSLLVLSAIVFSLPGVFLLLIAKQEAFSLVMGGMGVMALAGVVVNNNIILIDAYNEHRANGVGADEAAALAARERLRPIILTALTTATGLMPMVLGLTVDFFDRDVYFGAPSGQQWVQLASTIVGGLVVSTVITSSLTPTLLAWDGRRRDRRKSEAVRAAAEATADAKAPVVRKALSPGLWVYFGTYSLSLFGNGVASVLLPLLVLARTGDVLAAGIVVSVSAAVAAVAGLLAGVIVDRVNRRTVSIVSDVLSAASLAALPIVDAIWGLNMSWFIVLAVIGAMGDAPGMTARETLLPRLVQLDDGRGHGLDRLIGIREALSGALLLLGPGAGGLLVWFVGVSAQALIITAATSLLAGLLSFGISSRAGQVSAATAADPAKIATVLTDLKEAWTFLLGHRLVLGATLLSAVLAAVIVALQSTIMPAYFTAENLESLAGLAIGGLALGGMIGAGIYSAMIDRVSRRTWFVVGMIGAAVGFTVVGAMTSPWAVLMATVLIGLTNGPMSAVLGVAIIQATPDAMRGRVLGAQNALILAAPALSAAPVAAIAAGYGLNAAGMALAALVVLTAAIALLSPAFRSLDERSIDDAVTTRSMELPA